MRTIKLDANKANYCELSGKSSTNYLNFNKLFKIDTDGLVEQAALEVLVLGEFGEALEAEQAGGIAFLDTDLEVACGVKEGKFFSFPCIGIGLADPVDHFISFEDDTEASSLAMFFKFIAGDIHDDVLEIVDEDDLSFDPVITVQGPQVIFFQERRVGLTDFEQAFAVGQSVDGLAHDPGTIEGVFEGGLIERQADKHFRPPFKDHGEQAVVGEKDILFLVKGQEQLFRLLFEEIDQDDMAGVGGEVPDGIPADIGRLGVVKGGELVGDIDEGESRIYLQELAFYSAHEVVLLADVRSEGN